MFLWKRLLWWTTPDHRGVPSSGVVPRGAGEGGAGPGSGREGGEGGREGNRRGKEGGREGGEGGREGGRGGGREGGTDIYWAMRNHCLPKIQHY